MKRSSIITSACALVALIGAPGCQADTAIFVVITTDLQPPSGFTQVDIEAEDRSDPTRPKNHTITSYSVPGGPKLEDAGVIHFPATQMLLVPADTSREYFVKVTARRKKEDGEDEQIGLASKLVSPLPISAGLAAVRAPIDFLCNDPLCRDISNGKKTKCCEDENEVCLSDHDECVPLAETKDDPVIHYNAALVFGGGLGDGGGECFDAVGCFEGGGGPVFAQLDELNCELDVGSVDHVRNVGLATTEHGACGFKDCYVPLDPGVWRRKNDSTIKLPKRVCEWLVSTTPKGVIQGVVVTTDSDAHCPKQKTVELPICGIASSSGGDTPYSVVIAKEEPHPVSIAVDEEGTVYWANTGLFNATTSTFQNGSVVKHTVKDSYDVGTLLAAGVSSSFRDITVYGKNVLWTDGGADRIMCNTVGENNATAIVVGTNVSQPEGIAASELTVFWTQLDGKIKKAAIGDCQTVMGSVKEVKADKDRPFRIIASGDDACWTERTTINCTNDLLPKSSGDDTLRGLAVYPENDPVYGAVAVFSAGTILVVDLRKQKNGTNNGLESFRIEGQDHPSGVAVDEGYVYWTNWGDGTVKRASRHGCPTSPSTPELLAKGQHHPSGIVVTGDVVYWVNEGSIGVSNGSVVARAKPAPGAPPSNKCSVPSTM